MSGDSLTLPGHDGGWTAGQWLATRGPLPAADVVALITRIASLLDAGHAGGHVHRDVKPENIRLDAAGNPVLTDVGIAGPGPAGHPESPANPPTAYLAPEVLLRQEYSPASDIYALAATAYQLLAGVPPFDPRDPYVHNRIQGEQPPPLTRPDLPAGVSHAVLAGLAKDPAARPRSAGEFAWHLSSALAAGSAAAPQPGPLGSLGSLGRQPWLLSPLLLGAYFVLGLFSVFLAPMAYQNVVLRLTLSTVILLPACLAAYFGRTVDRQRDPVGGPVLANASLAVAALGLFSLLVGLVPGLLPSWTLSLALLAAEAAALGAFGWLFLHAKDAPRHGRPRPGPAVLAVLGVLIVRAALLCVMQLVYVIWATGTLTMFSLVSGLSGAVALTTYAITAVCVWAAWPGARAQLSAPPAPGQVRPS